MQSILSIHTLAHLHVYIIFCSFVLVQSTDVKIPSILAWTGYFHAPRLHTIFKERLKQENCPVDCNFVSRSEMGNETDYDAIIIHSRDIDLSDLPRSRKMDQLYFLFAQEAPGNRGDYLFRKFPPSFFNGTISYSQLSNYTFDYDFPAGDKINITAEFIGSKTQSVLGIVSNCGSESGRELIIDRLRKQMSLTLHGRCYGDKISNDDLQRLIKSHRFILALENKMCPEYVTEKGFRYKELIVPIVFSRRFVGNVLPSDSFIAIDDFNSTEELKEHLERLQNDDEEYLKYFAWIERKENREVRDKGVCKLCTDLHMIPRSHHSSLHRASFPDENMCIAPSIWVKFQETSHPRKEGSTIIILIFIISIVLLLIIALFLYYLRGRNYDQVEKHFD